MEGSKLLISSRLQRQHGALTRLIFDLITCQYMFRKEHIFTAVHAGDRLSNNRIAIGFNVVKAQ